METLKTYTLTGSWLNNSFSNMHGGVLGGWDMTDFANLDAPDYVAAGSTLKVRRAIAGTCEHLIATRTARRD